MMQIYWRAFDCICIFAWVLKLRLPYNIYNLHDIIKFPRHNISKPDECGTEQICSVNKAYIGNNQVYCGRLSTLVPMTRMSRRVHGRCCFIRAWWEQPIVYKIYGCHHVSIDVYQAIHWRGVLRRNMRTQFFVLLLPEAFLIINIPTGILTNYYDG